MREANLIDKTVVLALVVIIPALLLPQLPDMPYIMGFFGLLYLLNKKDK